MKFEKAWIEISHGNVLDISPKGRILLEDEDGAVSILDGFEEEDFYILKEGQCGNSLENNLNVWGKIIQENAQTVRCLVAFDKYPEFCVFGVEDTVEERHDLCSFSYDQSNQFGFDEEIGYLGLVAGSVAEAAILQDGGKVWWFQFDERGSSNDENKDSDEDHRTNTSETNSASDEGSVGDNEDNDEDSNSTTISEAGSTSDEGSVVVNEDSDEEDHTTAISETGSTSDEGSVDDRDERSRGRTRKRGNKVSVTCMYKHWSASFLHIQMVKIGPGVSLFHIFFVAFYNFQLLPKSQNFDDYDCWGFYSQRWLNTFEYDPPALSYFGGR